MQIERANLETCATATGVVVVIDVIRAFTTAACAFSAGAPSIIMVGTIEQAQELREHFPDALLVGEVGGYKPEGFDFGNSPSALLAQDLRGRQLIQRTSAGTQGMVRAQRAELLLAASLVVAGATARYLRQLDPPVVTLVVTGVFPDRDGDEDIACADYIEALLRGEAPNPDRYAERVRRSDAGQLFTAADHPAFPSADLPLCAAVDRFDFVLRTTREDGLIVLRQG